MFNSIPNRQLANNNPSLSVMKRRKKKIAALNGQKSKAKAKAPTSQESTTRRSAHE